MIVCIAEKPAVAREIADVLGAKTKKEGYIEGNGYQVTWTYGHLCTLKEPHDYTPDWKSWRMDYLPMVPPRFGIKLISNPTYEKQFRIIEGLMQQAEMIINCGDAGQEGELIQRWVMQKAGVRCPVKRLWISSLTEDSIREGFRQLHDAGEYQSLYEAGLSRAIGDWLLGMNATRLYTMKYGQNKQVLSIGRVQTPTLALIVNRQQEIENFVPKQYWELKTTYRDVTFSALVRKSDEDLALEVEKLKEKAQKTGSEFDAAEAMKQLEADNPGIDPIPDSEKGETLLQSIKELPFTVTDVSKKPGKEYAPHLFDLTSLQVECNKKYGYSAEDTLRIIQSLYEKKIATYPRVDTTYLSDDIYPKCPGILKGLRGYETYTAPLEGIKLPKSKRVFDNSKVTDHHAIIPTGQAPTNLTDMEKRVFDMIARRFIAAFYPDCKVVTTSVQGVVDEIPFKTSTKQIQEPGWRAVFSNTTQEEKDEEMEIRQFPAFVKGESGPHTPELIERWTQPPKPYTEATLLRAMETAGKLVDNDELREALKQNGIGRPSTRAAIIETLFKRNYIRRERKNLVATPTGVELIGIIHEELLKSAELTGLWEKKLRLIDEKKYSAATFLEEMKQMVAEIVQTVKNDYSNRHITIQEAVEENKPKRTKIASDGAPKEAKKRTTKKKEVAVKEGDPCPLCGKGTVIKGNTAYGCSEWRNGCTFRKPF